MSQELAPCKHASYCQRRMADGDRFGGCDFLDQVHCSPYKIGIVSFKLRHFNKSLDANQVAAVK